MGDHLGMGKPSQYATSHPGYLSLLTLAGWEMCDSQSAVMLCCWGVKTGCLISTVDERVGGR